MSIINIIMKYLIRLIIVLSLILVNSLVINMKILYGVRFIIMVIRCIIMVFRFLKNVVMCLLVFLVMVIVMLSNIVNIMICSILFCVKVLIGLLGNMLIIICDREGVFFVVQVDLVCRFNFLFGVISKFVMMVSDIVILVVRMQKLIDLMFSLFNLDGFDSELVL